MKVEYIDKQTYIEDRMPRACFGHGDRTAYVLSTDSKALLNKKFHINLWGEYDATLNIYADGYANLMKMGYSYRDEEFQEVEILKLTPDMMKKINLEEE